MTFRSGWCGRHALAWQHGHCRGSSPAGSPCVCDCHQPAPAVPVLRELVERWDLAALAAELELVLAVTPGDVPPCVHRLRAAAVELLSEVPS